MKRTIGAAAMAAAMSLAAAARAEPKGPFEVKSGIMESATEGIGQNTSILYFDDYGKKQATYSTTTLDLGGQKMVSRKLDIQLADGTSYSIDLDAKTGTKMKLPPEAAQAIALAMMSPEGRKQMNVTDLSDRDFLGRRCKGYQAAPGGGEMVTKTWVWKGLPLYSEAVMGRGKPIVIRATKLSVDVPVPADKFKAPAGIEMTDVQ